MESAEQLAQDKDTKVAKNIKAFFEIISQLQELDFNKDLDKFFEKAISLSGQKTFMARSQEKRDDQELITLMN